MQPAFLSLQYFIENNISPEAGYEMWMKRVTFELKGDVESLVSLLTNFYASSEESDEYFKDWIPHIESWIHSGDKTLFYKVYFFYNFAIMTVSPEERNKSFFQAWPAPQGRVEPLSFFMYKIKIRSYF